MKVENVKRKVENGKLKTESGKFGIKIFAVVLSLFTVFALGSCADENGLHDQNALMVTFEFTVSARFQGIIRFRGILTEAAHGTTRMSMS